MLEGLLFDELFSDESQYKLDHRGHTVVVVVENSGLTSTTVRLFVDGQPVHTKRAFSTTVRLPAELRGHAGPPHRTDVKVSLGHLGGVKSCVLIDSTGEYAIPRNKG